MNAGIPDLFYKKLGNGPNTLLLFHGFGQDHSVFISLANALSDKYTCYLFDLYFHGRSEWSNEDIPLEKSDWSSFIDKFLKENNIQDFSLLGYSLGAKFALATLESHPKQTNELFLIAPDAIKTSGWYSLATYPTMLRKLFKSMINNHSRFLAIARALQSMKLVDKGLLRFADLQMNTEERRRRVYYSWVVFRHLTFDMKKIATAIDTFGIPLTLIVGRYDKVIKPENMQVLLKHITKGYRYEILESGHNNLVGTDIAKFIL